MEDFENTPEFQALVVAATAKPERSMGDSIIPAEPPQWKEVSRIASGLLGTASTQLPLHIYLIQAETNIAGFTGFFDTLQAALHLLQENWDDLYPLADLDDPDDMYYARVNLVNELSEQPAFLDTIYRLPLVSVRGIGDFSTRDLDISAGTLTGSGEDQERCQEGLIRGAFAESEQSQLQAIANALEALPEICHAIEAVFAQKSGQQGVLSLDKLRKRIEACLHRFREYANEFLTPSLTDAVVDDGPEGREPDPSVSASHEPKASSTLANREMVTASFNALLVYYEQHEPSSPVRIMTANARNFVDKSFFEVLQAMAPDKHADLPAMLMQLREQPVASLLSDCYARYLGGERLPELSGNSHNLEVISSREQVLEVLQDIETYFINAEPSSPIPLIVADIRKLVPKRFMDLIVDFNRMLPTAAVEVSE